MKYTSLKGIQDILPPDIYIWQTIELKARELFGVYGFKEIRLPIIEYSDIFIRSIGETTDIVEKEMYAFADKSGRSITMRPEGTAPAVRCYVEHHLYNLPPPQKFFYSGPMFRYERPQRGRFRQFYQIGVEAFGISQPSIDAEIIVMLNNFLERIGLKGLNFELNCIGCEKCRPDYRDALMNFFKHKLLYFCPDCQRRYVSNPLRILDCKVEKCIELRRGSPVVTGYLCNECRSHFNELISILKALKIPYILTPDLVRGLDYYTKTAFEVTSEYLGAQKAVAAGGRYDRLVEDFGGPPTHAIGFAVGMERVVTLLKEVQSRKYPSPTLFIATIGREAELEGLRIAEDIRARGFWVEPNYGGVSLRSQLRKADRIGAEFAFIIGSDELRSGKIKWKELKNGKQGEVEIDNATKVLSNNIESPDP